MYPPDSLLLSFQSHGSKCLLSSTMYHGWISSDDSWRPWKCAEWPSSLPGIYHDIAEPLTCTPHLQEVWLTYHQFSPGTHCKIPWITMWVLYTRHGHDHVHTPEKQRIAQPTGNGGSISRWSNNYWSLLSGTFMYAHMSAYYQLIQETYAGALATELFLRDTRHLPRYTCS